MSGQLIIFWIVTLVTVLSAATVVFSKNLIYSAVALLFTLLGVAGLYVFLWADFIAVTQILIYVGGILVLIIFGIMLTHRITSVRLSHSSMQRGIGGAIVLMIFVGLTSMIFRAPWYRVAAVEPQETVRQIGRLLMVDYLLPFEVASVLLLAALMGAALLSRKVN
ncbi:MAG: NADH-quinone oxidoreductase subunit J [Candidatus Marinimicrobia bacterium]|jgi:NADH-quinone oxidoreductase subunit J|nr:NADH-quinone oxidoreductase subunit J [Candidatus Neomarinimicrobiota bacterium]MDP7059525.1 NADH-quinone oxidoreductase subunit J [Candidatus Neomarinimicrobiota bacterium]|tara:strand:- start:121 stop:615 length:495 start_codon:yes stop_codon:yes gene_type:complete